MVSPLVTLAALAVAAAAPPATDQPVIAQGAVLAQNDVPPDRPVESGIGTAQPGVAEGSDEGADFPFGRRHTVTCVTPVLTCKGTVSVPLASGNHCACPIGQARVLGVVE